MESSVWLNLLASSGDATKTALITRPIAWITILGHFVNERPAVSGNTFIGTPMRDRRRPLGAPMRDLAVRRNLFHLLLFLRRAEQLVRLIHSGNCFLVEREFGAKFHARSDVTVGQSLCDLKFRLALTNMSNPIPRLHRLRGAHTCQALCARIRWPTEQRQQSSDPEGGPDDLAT